MAVSSNAIIHYTKEFGRLEGILKEGFKIKYCSEKIRTRGGKNFSAGIAMISFCDLPLTNAKKHFSSYGFYGIGLSKKWAKRHGLNPVQYIDYNSYLGDALRKNAEKILLPENKDKSWKDSFSLLVAYSKNYEGKLVRDGKTKNDYRFYDEREWRYIPDEKEIFDNPRMVNLINYEKDKQLYNSYLSNFRLKFSIEDISFIIVELETDIDPLIKILMDIYQDVTNRIQLEKLLCKIITVEQIEQDF